MWFVGLHVCSMAALVAFTLLLKGILKLVG
jgi:hypothetical protein